MILLIRRSVIKNYFHIIQIFAADDIHTRKRRPFLLNKTQTVRLLKKKNVNCVDYSFNENSVQKTLKLNNIKKYLI